MVPDFSGYATKAGLKCSDGRTIMPDAFKDQDGITVPLVWQHGHKEPANVLGHAVLEHRADGTYCYAYFNDTPAGQNAKALVMHKDITQLSIYANQLVERAKQVFHGAIKEVSLVLSGANPGALIDQVAIRHSDGSLEELEDDVIIYTGLALEHEDKPANKIEGEPEVDADEDETDEPVVEHAGPDTTMQDVYDTLDEDQLDLVHFMIGAALETAAVQHSDTDDGTAASEDADGTDEDADADNGTDSTTSTESDTSDEANLEHKEGNTEMGVKRNVFEQNEADGTADGSSSKFTLTHDDMMSIVEDAKKGGSLKEAVEAFALAHNIEGIENLFPDAQLLDNRPEFVKRQTEWVTKVIGGTRHSPFSRIKSVIADVTFEEARARGYVKGSLKREEFFKLSARKTTPTTIYKKQALDRDDVVDITSFDVVAWLKFEMKMMLEEELARAILISDGRDVADPDKINEDNIRPISKEHELYATTLFVNTKDTNSSAAGNAGEILDAVIAGRRFYKGSGMPTFYTTENVIAIFLTQRDTLGRRVYRTLDEVAADLRVAEVVPVEVMEDEADLLGIIVNLQDYTIGADNGGELNMFDNFDIDYNKLKYLMETRCSGALTKVKSALVLRRTANAAAVLVVPTEPTFVEATGVITIPTVTGVVYKNEAGTTLTAGAQAPTVSGVATLVHAFPSTNAYFFANDEQDEWIFTRA
jgi:hypothetical protein